MLKRAMAALPPGCPKLDADRIVDLLVEDKTPAAHVFLLHKIEKWMIDALGGPDERFSRPFLVDGYATPFFEGYASRPRIRENHLWISSPEGVTRAINRIVFHGLSPTQSRPMDFKAELTPKEQAELNRLFDLLGVPADQDSREQFSQVRFRRSYEDGSYSNFVSDNKYRWSGEETVKSVWIGRYDIYRILISFDFDASFREKQRLARRILADWASGSYGEFEGDWPELYAELRALTGATSTGDRNVPYQGIDARAVRLGLLDRLEFVIGGYPRDLRPTPMSYYQGWVTRLDSLFQ